MTMCNVIGIDHVISPHGQEYSLSLPWRLTRATPRDIVLKVNQALVDSLRSAKVKEILDTSGAEAVGNPPEEFSRFLQTETVKWTKVVKAAGIASQ